MSATGAETHWLLSGDLPCLGCAYNLRGLVGPVVKCPECGRENDLRDPSPWRRKDLPLGVRQREHWPASAVFYSFLAGLPMGLGIIAMVEREVSLLCPLTAGIIVAPWGWQSWKWVKSARDARWAIGVLALIHVSAWAILFGVVAMVTGPTFFIVPKPIQPLWLLVSLGGVAGILVVRQMIARADQQKQFRQDWREYRVPIEESSGASDEA